MSRLRDLFQRFYAVRVLRLHEAKIRFGYWRLRHGFKLFVFASLALAVLTFLGESFLPPGIERYFSTAEGLSALRSLLGGTGSALIGAAAIAFSIIVFAMQTNIERMPHGLFAQLSSDYRLLSSFLGSFLTAIAVAGTSLIPDGSWAITAILAAFWGVVGIVLLFLFAYRRALQLINPIEQLKIMSREVQLDLRKWGRLAEKATFLLREVAEPAAEADGEVQFNVVKAAYYRVNSQWSTSALQAVYYAISYAKRFAEQGDYEVTATAFDQIVMINAKYCEVKHGTFVGSNPFLELPGVSDGLINASLEQLRQTIHGAMSKGDERLAESTLRAMTALHKVYLTIEYPGHERSKHHALLACTYLGAAVESVILHSMPDLMMQGLRMMGESAQTALRHANPNEIVSLVQKIGSLSYTGVAKADHQPVTLIAIEQLAKITFDLLVVSKRDIGYSAGQLRSAITTAAKGFLTTAETVVVSTHRSTLGSYFSNTSVDSFLERMTSLANELLEAPAEHEHAATIITNIEAWANQLSLPHKELVVIAVERRSSFAVDAIGWVVGISKVLNAVSGAPACPEHLMNDLRRHAVGLMYTLSWLPDDRESVAFIEALSLTDNLFEAALDGSGRGCMEFHAACKELLLNWAKKGGRQETGWGSLGRAIKALVALAIMEGADEAAQALNTKFGEMLASDGAPSEEIRQRTAEHLRTRAHELGSYHSFQSVDRALALQEPAIVRELLLTMVDMLAPHPEGVD